MALVSVYIKEEVAQEHGQIAPLIKNWARSYVQAAERDLLVAYLVIDICGQTLDFCVRFSF